MTLLRMSPLLDPETMNSTTAFTETEHSSSMGTGARLPPDILMMILEEFQAMDSLRPLCLVSIQFEDLLAPILYLHVVLTGEIVVQYGEYIYKKRLSDYSAF